MRTARRRLLFTVLHFPPTAFLLTVFLLTVFLLTVLLPTRQTTAQADSAVHRIAARPMQGLRADVAALVLNGREGGALWAAMLAAPLPAAPSAAAALPADEGRPNVALWIELDGSRLLGRGDDTEPEEAASLPDTLRVEVHAYAMRAGALAGHLSQSFRLPLDELGEVLDEGGVKFSGHLTLEPGEYELRVLLRERSSERFVLHILPLRVPAADGAEPELLAPFFADVEGAWIEVSGPDTGPAGPNLSPSTLPVLRAGRTVTARQLLYGQVPYEQDAAAPRLKARVLDAQRQPLDESSLELTVEPSAGVSTQPRSFDVSFALPDDLLTGNYFLETALGATQWGTSGVRATQIYVLGLEREEENVVWTDLQRLSALSERRREALDLASKRRAAKRNAAIVRAYRDVLELLGSGSVDEAVEDLGRLEVEVVESDPVNGRNWLAAAQGQVAGRLAQAGAESLIPVLFLHMERHRLYVRDGQRLLTFHARERVMETARLYAGKAGSELAPTLAATVLSDMGAALNRARMQVAARRMLQEALALDERNGTALLGLAVDHEHHGDYAAAAVYLRRLLEIEPHSEEGRLRLALDLRRGGETEEARRLLQRLIDDGATEWLLTLAYQELARIFLALGRSADAARLLEAGVRRLPAQKRLYIQLAYALDLTGNSRRAREVIRSIPTGDGSMEASPRLLYSRFIEPEPEPGRSDIVRQSMVRLAALARALSRSEEKR